MSTLQVVETPGPALFRHDWLSKIQLDRGEIKALGLSKTPKGGMQRKVDQLLQKYESVFSEGVGTLNKVFSEFGVPDVVRSDNGLPFNSNEWTGANGEVERFVRTVKKVIKTAKVEHKNPKQKQNKLLRNYRATRSTQYNKSCSSDSTVWKTNEDETTRVTTRCCDPEIQERDRTAKAKMRKHTDNKCYIKPSTVKEGNTVFVRIDDSKKKSDMPYDPRPLVVVEKKRSMVSAQDDNGIPVTRNSSFFKSVPAAAEETSTTEIRKDPAHVTSAPDTTDALMQSDAALSRSYPQPVRTHPVKSEDYVCG